ncbi:hypothetical protein GDO81_005241 [Engystomops pustulosus]|uniref:Stress-associated endoplasmic reticulum protein n=1 Tax=Engystomops pustulosus TaxID=76066 RepID=A0AAV7CMZ7_ENGPU|nr:hypothetical protein GDO81_005241 [Engystomops pustulosus]
MCTVTHLAAGGAPPRGLQESLRLRHCSAARPLPVHEPASLPAETMVAKQRIKMANEKHSKNITQRGNVAKTLPFFKLSKASGWVCDGREPDVWTFALC